MGYDCWELLPVAKKRVCEAHDIGASSRIWYEGSRRSGRGHTVQLIGCIVCIGPYSVTSKYLELDHNKCHTTTLDHGTAVTATKRQQRSAGNVCAPNPTSHDEDDADITTTGTQKGWTIWRTRRWTWPKQQWTTRSVVARVAAT